MKIKIDQLELEGTPSEMLEFLKLRYNVKSSFEKLEAELKKYRKVGKRGRPKKQSR